MGCRQPEEDPLPCAVIGSACRTAIGTALYGGLVDIDPFDRATPTIVGGGMGSATVIEV